MSVNSNPARKRELTLSLELTIEKAKRERAEANATFESAVSRIAHRIITKANPDVSDARLLNTILENNPAVLDQLNQNGTEKIKELVADLANSDRN